MRHTIAWAAAGSNPDTWQIHMDLIRLVYGY